MFDELRNKLTAKVGIKLLETQRHSPAIMIGVAAVGVIGTAIMAGRGTLKMDQILRESEEKTEELKNYEGQTTDGAEYTEDDRARDLKLHRTQTAIKIAKAYAPAVGIGILTVGAMTGSHVILNRRYISVSAAYAAVDKAFKQYRSRVVSELGKEKDEEFRYGVVEREVAVDDETGTHVITVKDRDLHGHSMYARLFDVDTSSIWQREPGYNSMRINSIQNQANDRLNAIGYVFLNDVYKWLGMEPTKAGQAVGWLKKSNGGRDGFISFGAVEHPEYGDDFLSGDDRAVYLDFNVDGSIWDMLDEIAKEKQLAKEKSKAKKANATAKEHARRFAAIQQERQ